MVTVLVGVGHDSYFGGSMPVFFDWWSVLVRDCELVVLPERPLEIRTCGYAFLGLQRLVVASQVGWDALVLHQLLELRHV